MPTLQSLEPDAFKELERTIAKLRLLGWRVERFDRLRDEGFILSMTPPSHGHPQPRSEVKDGRRGG